MHYGSEVPNQGHESMRKEIQRAISKGGSKHQNPENIEWQRPTCHKALSIDFILTQSNIFLRAT